MKCPRKYSNREPVDLIEYENGFYCTCVVPDTDAPETGAPADIIKVCEVMKPCAGDEDDVHDQRREIDAVHYLTPAEAIGEIASLVAVVSAWFEKSGLEDALLDEKLYSKVMKVLSKARG